MLEKAPGPTGNLSINELHDDLEPNYTGGGFNHYKDPVDGKSYFAITSDPKEQFIISELAAMIMPVSTVFSKNMPHGEIMHFVPDIKDHPAYDPSKEEMDPNNHAMLYMLFGDIDHDNSNNYGGTVFHDFNAALLDERYDSFIDKEIQEHCNWFIKEHPDQIQELRQKASTFRDQVKEESGLTFLKALFAKARYTNRSPEEFQRVLIRRCDAILEMTME